MTEQELLYTIALTRVLPMNSTVQNQLLDTLHSATAIYEHRQDLGDVVPEASKRLLHSVAQMDAHLGRAEQEIRFARQGRIQCIGRDDEAYPTRLRHCTDAPILLYYCGTAPLNRPRVVSMVGTRHCTDYGRQVCKRFLRELSEVFPDVLVVSGLAYGIDIVSHREALECGMETVGVLAHGLDQIYPRMHRDTAAEMTQRGGLLTEFMSYSTPEKLNFVSRNRIVAGMSDATIVVESKAKGGSLITASLAQDYGRDVYAVPGRMGDEMSEGCNHLIRNNNASILLSAEDFVASTGWEKKENNKEPVQRRFFVAESPEEENVISALSDGNPHDLNHLATTTGLSVQRLVNLLFDLEMREVVRSLNGSRYVLVSY